MPCALTRTIERPVTRHHVRRNTNSWCIWLGDMQGRLHQPHRCQVTIHHDILHLRPSSCVHVAWAHQLTSRFLGQVDLCSSCSLTRRACRTRQFGQLSGFNRLPRAVLARLRGRFDRSHSVEIHFSSRLPKKGAGNKLGRSECSAFHSCQSSSRYVLLHKARCLRWSFWSVISFFPLHVVDPISRYCEGADNACAAGWLPD